MAEIDVQKAVELRALNRALMGKAEQEPTALDAEEAKRLQGINRAGAIEEIEDESTAFMIKNTLTAAGVGVASGALAIPGFIADGVNMVLRLPFTKGGTTQSGDPTGEGEVEPLQLPISNRKLQENLRLHVLPPGEGIVNYYEDFPISRRIGEDVGFGAPFTGLAIKMGKAGFEGPKLFRAIFKRAAEKPVRFAAGETAIAAGGGAGSGMAHEKYKDEGPGIAITADVGGSFLGSLAVSPGVSSAYKLTRAVFMNVDSLTRHGVHGNVASIVQGAIGEGNVDEAIASLQRYINGEGEFLPGELTSPQIIQEGGLTQIERWFVQNDVGLSGDYNAGLNAMTDGIERELRATYGPLAGLREGGITEQQAADFLTARIGAQEELLDRSVAAAMDRAAIAIQVLNPVGNRRRSNRIIQGQLDEVFAAATATDTNLWRQAPNPTVDTTPLRLMYEKIQRTASKYYDDEALPGIAFMFDERRLGYIPDQDGLKAVVKAREIFMSLARHTVFDDEKLTIAVRARYNDMADAALQIMAGAVDKIPGGVLNKSRKNYLNALAFSGKYRDTFLNENAGDVARLLGMRGGDPVDPQLFLETTLGRGGPAGVASANKILRATGFDPKTGAVGNSELADDAVKQFILSRFALDVIRDGKVNVGKYDAFVSEDRFGLLLEDRFPDLKAQFEAARRGAVDVLDLAEAAKATREEITHSAANLYLKMNVNQVVPHVLESADSTRRLSELVRSARKDKTGEALEGVKDSVLKYMLSKTQTGLELPTGKHLFDDEALTLFAGKHKRAFLNSGLFTADEMGRMQTVVKTARALSFRTPSKSPGIESNLLFADLGSILGARTGSRFATVGGSALVMAGIGRRIMKRVFGDKAKFGMEKLIIKAIKDPKVMLTLLTVPTVKNEALLSRRLRAHLGMNIPRVQQAQEDKEEFERRGLFRQDVPEVIN